MSQTTQVETSLTPLGDQTIALLHKVSILSSLNDADMHCLDGSRELFLEPGTALLHQGDQSRNFWMLLEGHLHLSHNDPDGRPQQVYAMEPGNSFGEVPLLAGTPAPANIIADDRCHLLELDEDQFWNLLTHCPEVRRAILANMAMRLAKVQSATFQQEKMVALGTLAAGLMHELNNPGTAARRASTQLRENLMRLHQLAAKFSRTEMSPDQKQCMFDLQDFALTSHPATSLSSLEQADAEDNLAQWLESAQIEDSWRIAPTLVSIGIDANRLQCAQAAFTGEVFSDALHWLEALVSSMQLVGTIEESIGRVTELVKAVKSYAYEGRGQKQELDVNQSIQNTLVILGHKLREKQIAVQKDLSSGLPVLHTQCQGLNQIWTNLLDNAIDAAPQGGRIAIKTWSEAHVSDGTSTDPSAAQQDLCILVSDNGSGVPLESQAHIFDSFYTTKPAGVGTGLGLGIVHRIVEQIGGTIRFSSMPGDTEFIVRLPAGN